VFLKEILDLREGMTAELRCRPSDDQYSPLNHGAKPWAFRGRNRQFRVNAQFAHSSHCLHQEPVKLQDRKISATLLVEAPLVSLVSLNLNYRLLASGALTSVQKYRTGSDTHRLRSFF
jgi:hypothetical protein